jgi:hypothetical protein
MLKLIKSPSTANFKSLLAFIALFVLLGFSTVNAQQSSRGQDGCIYFNNGYDRRCQINNYSYYHDKFINNVWTRVYLVDESERGFTKMFAYAMQTWYSVDNATAKEYVNTNLGWVTFQYVGTELYIKDKRGIHLVSPTGNPNGPWRDSNEHVGNAVVGGGIIADMNRDARIREEQNWEKNRVERKQEAAREQKQYDRRAEDKKRYGY